MIADRLLMARLSSFLIPELNFASEKIMEHKIIQVSDKYCKDYREFADNIHFRMMEHELLGNVAVSIRMHPMVLNKMEAQVPTEVSLKGSKKYMYSIGIDVDINSLGVELVLDPVKDRMSALDSNTLELKGDTFCVFSRVRDTLNIIGKSGIASITVPEDFVRTLHQRSADPTKLFGFPIHVGELAINFKSVNVDFKPQEKEL